MRILIAEDEHDPFFQIQLFACGRTIPFGQNASQLLPFCGKFVPCPSCSPFRNYKKSIVFNIVPFLRQDRVLFLTRFLTFT